jgi:hypothetical protein
MSALAHSSPHLEAPNNAVAKHARSRLPRLFPGYLLSTIALLAFAGGLMSTESDLIPFRFNGEFRFISTMFDGTAMAYWLFCVYRLHKVMAGVTHDRYPISPKKAFWLSFVPLYSMVWAVVWPNRLAHFLKEQNPSLRIATRWPGVLTLLALLFGAFGLRGFLLFAVMTYLNRKIKGEWKLARPLPLITKKQLDLAISAGLGAGFGLILCKAIQNFSQKHDKLHELIAITIVSVGIVKFIEPLAEWVRNAFKLNHPHTAHGNRPWIFKAAILLAVLFSSFSHELLDKQIHENTSEAVRLMVAMLLVSGTITYSWVRGARCKPARAARWGFLSGGGIALVLLLALWQEPTSIKQQSPSQRNQEIGEGAAGPISVPLIIGAEVGSVRAVAIPLSLWALFGLIGGLAIDHRWLRGSVPGVVLSILIGAFILVLTFRFTASVGATEMALGTSAVLGWCLTLLIFPGSEIMLCKRVRSHT